MTSSLQIGRWTHDQYSGMTCLSSCNRQENPVSTSTYKFPNKMFLRSKEMFVLVKKLVWSCTANVTRFGPKIRLLDIKYPRLCSFYDQFIYSNQDIMEYLDKDPPLFGTISEFLTQYSPVEDYVFPNSLGMNNTEMAQFSKELLNYGEDNLVVISAFMESPYVKTYQTDQVGIMECHAYPSIC